MEQEVIYNIDTKLLKMIEMIVDKFFEEYFENIISFLKRKKQDQIDLKLVEKTNNDFY